jgi:hypothetical protein
MRDWRWCVGTSVAALTACDAGREASEDRPHGPEGGLLTFDAAMLSEPDAGPAVWEDGGPPRRDVGPPRYDAGPAMLECAGSATPCSLRPVVGCTDGFGCSVGGDCSGSARSCYSIFDSYSCNRQDGCYWSTSSDDCSGSARSCSGYTGGLTCESQDGCDWTDECEGFARSCDLISLTFCTTQPGCRVEEE